MTVRPVETYGVDSTLRTYADLFSGHTYSTYGRAFQMTVTPPTSGFDPSVDADEHRPNVIRMFNHYKGAPVGVTIFRLQDDTITTTQPAHWEDVKGVFYGGHDNQITAEEAVLLANAGYDLSYFYLET